AAQQVDVIDDHDRVVHDDADEHHDAHEALQVQRRAREEHRRHDADDRDRHAAHDYQRIDKALELRGHDHVDQRDRHQDSEQKVALGALLLLVLAAEIEAEAFRQRHVGERFADALDGLAERNARLEVRGDIGDAEPVDAIDRRGAAAFFLSDERGDRQNPFGGAYRDVVDIGQAQAVIGPEPDVDVDFLAVQPIDAGAPAADARLYRRADILHGDTEPGHALAVELHVLLRPALLVARVRVDDARDFQDAID